jgi:hypothetical protein
VPKQPARQQCHLVVYGVPNGVARIQLEKRQGLRRLDGARPSCQGSLALYPELHHRLAHGSRLDRIHRLSKEHLPVIRQLADSLTDCLQSIRGQLTGGEHLCQLGIERRILLQHLCNRLGCLVHQPEELFRAFSKGLCNELQPSPGWREFSEGLVHPLDIRLRPLEEALHGPALQGHHAVTILYARCAFPDPAKIGDEIRLGVGVGHHAPDDVGADVVGDEGQDFPGLALGGELEKVCDLAQDRDVCQFLAKCGGAEWIAASHHDREFVHAVQLLLANRSQGILGEGCSFFRAHARQSPCLACVPADILGLAQSLCNLRSLFGILRGEL